MIRRTVIAGAGVCCARFRRVHRADPSGATSAGSAARACRRVRARRQTAINPFRSGSARRARRCQPEPRRSPSKRWPAVSPAHNFRFLPDGRIIVAEQDGRIRLVGKDGGLSEPLAGMPSNMYPTRPEPVRRPTRQELRQQPHGLSRLCRVARWCGSGHAGLAHARARGQREDLCRRQGPRGRQGSARCGGHGWPGDSERRRHAAGDVHGGGRVSASSRKSGCSRSSSTA